MAVSGKWQGKKIKSKQGDKITMAVDGQTIKWKVGSEVRQSFSHAMIADASIPWVPFIMMIDKGDRIRW